MAKWGHSGDYGFGERGLTLRKIAIAGIVLIAMVGIALDICGEMDRENMEKGYSLETVSDRETLVRFEKKFPLGTPGMVLGFSRLFGDQTVLSGTDLRIYEAVQEVVHGPKRCEVTGVTEFGNFAILKVGGCSSGD